MRKLQAFVAAGVALAILAVGRWVVAQDVFTLGFEGPASLAGEAGTIRGDTYHATLGHAGKGSGAQGWSFSIVSEKAAITSITTAGTIADRVENGGLYRGGFQKTEVVDRTRNDGKTGAVSAVILSLIEGTTLPANATHRVAKMEVAADIPAGGAHAKLFYQDGLRGVGQPVANIVIQHGGSRDPVENALTIDLIELTTCCDDPVNVGFSDHAIRGGSGFEGISDATDLCSAAGGEIRFEVDEGRTLESYVYANVISNLEEEEGGVQGWSFGILSENAEIRSVTTAGTIADRVENGGLFSGGFQKTEVVDSTRNDGKTGAVSAVVLSLTEGTTLPFVGTESVLRIGLRSIEPQGEEGRVGTLSFRNGLRGAGQPVGNVLTVAGDSTAACNFGTAEVDVVFVQRIASDFIRGDANGDVGVDIGDPIWTINALFHAGPPATCADASDANDDGIVDASDAVYLIDYLFRAQASPRAPFPGCGVDPTEDTLACPESSPGC